MLSWGGVGKGCKFLSLSSQAGSMFSIDCNLLVSPLVRRSRARSSMHNIPEFESDYWSRSFRVPCESKVKDETCKQRPRSPRPQSQEENAENYGIAGARRVPSRSGGQSRCRCLFKFTVRSLLARDKVNIKYSRIDFGTVFGRSGGTHVVSYARSRQGERPAPCSGCDRGCGSSRKSKQI